MIVCAQCGRPVEERGEPLDRFGTPADAEAAGPVLHPECVLLYDLRDRPVSRVLMYEGPEVGPLTPDAPER